MVRPNVSVETNSDQLVGSASDDSIKKLMLVGMARGGEPNKIYRISTYADAKAIFRGGDLLDAIEVAMTPNDTYHSGTILAQRVGKATQATYVNKGLTITSNAYSLDANTIQTALTKNTLNNTHTLTVSFAMDSYTKIYTNLGKIFGIYYTGTQNYTDVSVEVDNADDGEKHTGFATKLVLKAGADKSSASVVKEFPLGQGVYTKISALISAINDIEGFNAVYFYHGNKNIETKYLDPVDEQEISKNGEAPTYLNSLGGDIVTALESEADPAIYAEYSPIEGEPDTYDLTTLSGGSSSEVPPASWAKEFSNFGTQGGYYLVPLTDDVTVQAEAMAFCADRNSEADPRSLIVGGGINESANSSVQRAFSLRTTDARVGVIACSGTRNMNNGVKQDLPAYIIAAMVGGLATGLDVGESITFKDLGLIDVDQKFTKEQLDMLDSSGVISIEYVRNRTGQQFRITNDITTAAPISKDVGVTELGTGETIDFLATYMRSRIEELYIGTSTSLASASDIKTTIIGILQQEQNGGIIQDYKESDIHVTVSGEAVLIQIECVLARTLKDIKIGITFKDEVISA